VAKPPSLLAAIEAATPSGNGALCSVADLLDHLDEADRTDLLTALARPTKQLQSTVIARVLKARSLPISPSAIQRHRRGGCTCQS
jgi:hypothetical protein